MALSRLDEFDLLIALHDGLYEEPKWGTFLHRVQRRTRADHVSLIVGQGDAPIHLATQWFAGRDVRTEAQRMHDLAQLDPTPYRHLRPGRVYSAAEMIEPSDPQHDRFRRDYLDRIGVKYGRFMRVTEPGGRNAWINVARAGTDFGGADSALLSALAPHLSIALRTLGELEQARFRAAVAEDALARAGIGWATLDRDGRMIDRGGTPYLRTSSGRHVAAGSVEAERALTRMIGEAAVDHQGHALTIGGNAPIDVLVVAAPDRPLVASVMPAAVALTRIPRPAREAQATALAKLFGLSASESRLATRLADGQNLAEAAAALGLTIETARNYSKRLFAKTGTRGQAELVRIVLTNVAGLG